MRERKNGLGSVRAVTAFIENTGIQANLLFVGKVVGENYANRIKVYRKAGW